MNSLPCFALLLLAAAGSILRAETGGQVPLAQALESGGMVWRTGTEAPWFGSALYSHDGVDAARSGGGGSGESWLETEVTGPGDLSFWLKSMTSGARVLLNGVALEVTPGEWGQRKLRLGPGTQRVRFLVPHREAGSTGADAVFLDGVNFTPQDAVSMAVAAEAPGLTWMGGPGTFGYRETGAGISGGDVVVVQGQSHVLAEVTGPAAVRFRWKMPDASPDATLTVRSGANPLVWILSDSTSGPDGWIDAEVLVPAGAQTVRWEPEGAGDFLLDAVSVVPSPSTGVAVGQAGLTWSGDWLTRPAEQAAGGGVAVTPVLALDQRAALTTTITGPAEVTYVSSLLYAEGNNQLAPRGAVTVQVDGAWGTARTVEEADGWRRTTIFVPEGAHTVSWVVENHDPVSWWSQPHFYQGVLDDVRITPASVAELAESLKTTLAPQVTGGAGLSGRWRGMKSLTSGVNGSAAVCGPLAEGEATTLSFAVTGPARLLFSLRGERWRWDSQLLFEAKLDDVTVLDSTAVTGPSVLPVVPPLPPEEWRTVQISIPSGAHTVTLRAAAQSPGALLWLDGAGYLPPDPGESKIATAVGMTGTLWRRASPPGRGAWRVLATPMARERQSMAACLDVAAGQSASLETTITGPGALAFSWGQSGSGRLEAFVNNESAASAWQPFSSDPPQDERVELLLPAGAHALRWTFKQDAAPVPSSAIAQAWLDRVKFTPSPAGSSPAAGLDVTAVVTTDSAWPWRTAAPEFSATGDGDAAMVEVSAGGRAWLEMPLTGPGRVAFWWRAEAETNTGIGLAVDGAVPLTLPGTNDWYRAELSVGPGPHALRWMVDPAITGSVLRSRARRVWLDGFVQLPTLPLAEALDGSGLTWTTGEPSVAGDFTGWMGLPAEETAASPGTDDAAVTSGTRALTTQVTGPGVVTFRWAEKTVPPQPVVEAPEPPLSPSGPVVLGGGSFGLVMVMVGGWDWNWWNQPPPPRAVFAVNGVSRATLDLSETGGVDYGFNTHTIHLGPGTHTLTWQRPTRSDSRRLVVESVSFTPAPDVLAPVAAELGVPVAGVTMNNTPWTVQSVETHDGTAALQSGNTTGGASTLEMEFTGPGELSFWWKGTGGADFRNPADDPVTVGWMIIQNARQPWHAPADWQRLAFAVPSGTQRYIWRAPHGATLWLDEVVFSTPQPLTGPNALAEALDFSGLTWNAPGWEPMTGGGLRETRDALSGPEYGGAEDPWIETTVTGPVWLEFSWWTESFAHTGAAGAAGTVRVSLDGVDNGGGPESSGRSQTWVPDGSHTLRIQFQSGTARHRRPVLDDVRLSMPVEEALEQPALTWTMNVPASWKGWRSDRYPGHGTYVHSPDPANGDPLDHTLSVAVTGPALVSFDVLPPPPDPPIFAPVITITYSGGTVEEPPALLVDGVPVWSGPESSPGWQTVQAAVGNGAHVLTWKAGNAYRFVIDRCTITPGGAAAPAVDEAIDAPGRVFSTATGWSGMNRAGDAARPDVAAASVRSGDNALLTTSITGPAWVTFDHTQTNARLTVKLDTSTLLTVPEFNAYRPYSPRLGETLVWRTQRLFVEAGTHELSWQASYLSSGGLSGLGTTGAVQLDALTVTPVLSGPDTVTLAEAMDAPGLTFTVEGSAAWSGGQVTDGNGADAAMVYGRNNDGKIKTTVTGPGTVVFRWKPDLMSVTAYYNSSLQFWVDGVYVAGRGAPGTMAWETIEWPLSAGAHELEWRVVSHNGSVLAWVDALRLLPPPSLAEALDLPPGLTVSVESGEPAPVTMLDGTDAVNLAQPAGAPRPVLRTTVTGPGELSFDYKNTATGTAAEWADAVTIDGQPAGQWLTTGANYSRVFTAVGAGGHVIRWSAAPGLWLDRVSWSDGVPAWAQAAGGIGTNGVSAWITGGTVPWSAAPGEGLGNGAAAKSDNGWLQAVVPPGPGTLCWWGRTANPGTNGGLTGPSSEFFNSLDWRFRRESRTAGQPSPVWNATAAAFLTGVSFTPAQTVPLPHAVDAPAVIFETSPDSPWSGVVTEGAPLGASAAKSGFSTSWLRATFTGPGRLNYSSRLRRTGSTAAWAQAEIEVSTGIASTVFVTSAAWESASLWLEAGVHTVTWSLRFGGQGDEFWLDAVQFTPSTPLSLAEALEYNSAPWATGGAGNWTGLSTVPDTTGDGAAHSPSLQENEESWLETTVPGSGVLTWRWRMRDTSHGGFDFLLDGLPLTRVFIDRIWQAERWELPAGPHTLRWRFTARATLSGQAMLDAVTFTPGPPPAWDAALGAQTVPVGGGGVSPWQVVTQDGVTSLHNERTASLDGFSTLYADVAGPAVLTVAVRANRLWYFMRDEHENFRHGESAWEDLRQFIPAGRHRLRWAMAHEGNLDLRQLTVSPLTTVPLVEAMEAAGLTIFDEAASWVGVREPERPGDDDYAVALVEPDSTRVLEVEFTGPGVLRASWDWPAQRLENGVRLLLKEGETELMTHFVQPWGVAGSDDMMQLFGPGTHRVQLEADANQQFFEARLTSVQFEQWPATDISGALGAPGLTFTTGGDGWWGGLVKPEWAHDGNSVVYARVGPWGSGWLETEITGPADVSFWHRISAPHFSRVHVMVDGFQQRTLSNENVHDITGTETLRIPPGTHNLRWEWQPGGEDEPGLLNALLLDRLRVTPLVPVSLAEAADAPGLTFTPVAGDWAGWNGSDAISGGDLIEVSRVAGAPGDPLSLTVSLTGPGVLRWEWKNAQPSYGFTFSARLDGRMMAQAAEFRGGWQPGVIALPPGAQTVTFEVGAGGGTGVIGQFDGFVWKPTGAATTMEAAAEATGLTNLAPATPGDWFPVEDAALSWDGVDALAAGVPGRTHRLLADAAGAGTVGFVTNANSTTILLNVYVDGRLSSPLTPAGIGPGPRRLFHFAGAGNHTIEWAHEGQAFYQNESYLPFLDSLTWTPAASVPLAAAVEQPGLTFRTGGPQPWQGGTSPGGANGHLAYSSVTASQPGPAESWVETDVTGPGGLYTNFVFPSGVNRLYLDGVLQPAGQLSSLSAGPHTIRWAIAQTVPAVTATATLDNLDWQPGTWPGWQTHHFPAGTLEALMSVDADPDHDGLANGIEALLGNSPLRPDSTPPLTIESGANGDSRILFIAVAEPPADLEFSVQSAESLAGPWRTFCSRSMTGAWTGNCHFDGATAPGRNRFVLYALGSERFFRLRVAK